MEHGTRAVGGSDAYWLHLHLRRGRAGFSCRAQNCRCAAARMDWASDRHCFGAVLLCDEAHQRALSSNCVNRDNRGRIYRVCSCIRCRPGRLDLLSKPLPRFYGRISFSFYLLHLLTLAMIWFMPNRLGDLVDVGIPRPLLALGLALATALVTTPLAYISYRVAERQGIAARRSCVSMLVVSLGRLTPSTGVPATSSPRL